MDSAILLTVCFHGRYFDFDSTFLYVKVYFTLILNKLVETPLFCILGRAARRSNVSDYVYRRHQQGLKCSCLTDKQSCKHLENAH